MSESFFFSRHTERADKSGNPESERYPGITEEGVEKSWEGITPLVEMIDKAPRNAVVFLGGASEEQRTKSTAEVLGDALEEHYRNNPGVFVITKSDLVGADNARKYAHDIVESKPENQVVVTYPLYIRELSLRPLFRDSQTGEHTPLSKELFARAGGGTDAEIDERATTLLMEGKGGLDGVGLQELAVRQITGVERLREFARQIVGDRPVIIGITGHAWNLDALASCLANEGSTNIQGYERVGEKMIDQAEIGIVSDRDDGTYFTYRGKEYLFSHKDKQ